MSYYYRDLIAWQKARTLARETYRATDCFPRSETYGLAAQIRRAAVSVVANIAEGQGRITRGEFIQFLGHSRGSLLELETELTIAYDLGYLDELTAESLSLHTKELTRVLNGLIESLRKKAAEARTS